jgi:two-component system chemotaxis response regulator CheY
MSSNLKILIVDDFEMMRFQLKKELTAIGCTYVTEASDGKQAIELLVAQAKVEPFDIVFCDWNMPNVTGMEVLKFCRETPAYKWVPFIMVTAEAEQEAVVKAIKAGASDYIVKPTIGDALPGRIRSIISRVTKNTAA